MMKKPDDAERIRRRTFAKNGTLILAAATADPAALLAEDSSPGLRIGLVTDLHYADKPPVGTRNYRETTDKLAEAAVHFSTSRLTFLVELGDLIDSADSVTAELQHLQRINRDFSAICPNRHYVLGNHCVHTLTKEEFLAEVEQRRGFYSFDSADFHFVVLDSCFRSDGRPYGRKNFEWTDPNIPLSELEWLQDDLAKTPKKTIVFAHQRLDVSNQYGVKNAPAVRRVLQASKKVLAVFQGHSHKNAYREIGGIHYCTLVAMVEGSGAASSGYAVLNLSTDGTIRLTGFRRQSGYSW